MPHVGKILDKNDTRLLVETIRRKILPDLVGYGDSAFMQAQASASKNICTKKATDLLQLNRMCWLVLVPEACSLIRQLPGSRRIKSVSEDMTWLWKVMAYRESIVLGNSVRSS
jgi:hypothetical protein